MQRGCRPCAPTHGPEGTQTAPVLSAGSPLARGPQASCPPPRLGTRPQTAPPPAAQATWRPSRGSSSSDKAPEQTTRPAAPAQVAACSVPAGSLIIHGNQASTMFRASVGLAAQSPHCAGGHNGVFRREGGGEGRRGGRGRTEGERQEAVGGREGREGRKCSPAGETLPSHHHHAWVTGSCAPKIVRGHVDMKVPAPPPRRPQWSPSWGPGGRGRQILALTRFKCKQHGSGWPHN